MPPVEPVYDYHERVSPLLIPAEWAGLQDMHLACGKCGFSDRVTHVYFVSTSVIIEGVCNCPVPGRLEA